MVAIKAVGKVAVFRIQHSQDLVRVLLLAGREHHQLELFRKVPKQFLGIRSDRDPTGLLLVTGCFQAEFEVEGHFGGFAAVDEGFVQVEHDGFS